jgi:signal transduction histidine kinase
MCTVAAVAVGCILGSTQPVTGVDYRSGMAKQLGIVAGVTLLVIIGAVTAPAGYSTLDITAVTLLVAASLTIAARRRLPVTALAVATLCLVTYVTLGYPGLTPALPMLFALYAAVKAGRPWAAGTAVGVTLVAGFAGEVTVSHAAIPAPDIFQRWFLLVGWMAAASIAAQLSRQRGAYLDQVRRRADEAERSREETARRRADAERIRIARELHDSLTHSISIIKVQAGVAVHLARKHDEPVPQALLAIQEASADAMRELRAALEVLRAEPAAVSGLDRLDALIEGVRRGGLPVDVTVVGEPRFLPPPVDRTAYRIIQEALTNTARHAGPASASVRLAYQDHNLTVRVEDTGAGEAPVNPGLGLVGMRERVTALGGSLSAGPRKEGGFRVYASLPTTVPS